jgi:hypothetical protein
MATTPAKPWYREPWPWILASGPLIAVVAGLYTFRLAVTSNDGLVAEDYYKQGLAADKTIAQSGRAAAVGLTAKLQLRAEAINLVLSSTDSFVQPDSLRLTMSHPTRAGMDQTITLTRQGDSYSAALRLPASGHWLVLIEDQEKTWRLLGNVLLPSNEELVIGHAAAKHSAGG